MYEYILFDLDGTISDPKVGICTSVQYALKKHGITVNSIDELTPFIGPPLRNSFKEFYDVKDEDVETVIGYYRERFSTVGLFENDLYEGIPELLEKLKENGKKLAISSSKPRVFVEKILIYFKINQYFDVIMGSELNGTRESKTEVILETFRRLFGESEPDYAKCIMVGDRKFDVEGAHSCNIPCIGVSYGYGSKEELVAAGADIICDKVAELSKVLLAQ